MTNRQEVAEKLREGSTARTTNEVYVVLLNSIGITHDYPTMFDRLADLIDPTCHIVETVEDGKTMYVCSNCYSCKSDDKDIFSQFNYCPVCGARVVRDE